MLLKTEREKIALLPQQSSIRSRKYPPSTVCGAGSIPGRRVDGLKRCPGYNSMWCRKYLVDGKYICRAVFE